MTASSRPTGWSVRRGLTALAAGVIAIPLSAAFAASASAATPPGSVDDTQKACPPSQVQPAGFTDISGDTFQNSINCIAAYGIAHGATATTYNPSGTVSRAQMAVFFYNIGNYAGFHWNTASAGFTDISGEPQGFQDAINALANAGVVHGTQGAGQSPTYNPGGPVSRGQMATFINQFEGAVFGAKFPAGPVYFTDTAGNVHEADIDAIVQAKVASGTSATTFSPNANTRRNQMAGFIGQDLEVNIDNGKLTSKYSGVVPLSTSANPTTVAPGQNANLTITGQNIKSYAVSGPCTAGVPTTQTNPQPTNGNQQTINVAVPVSQSAAGGSCTLTTTVTYLNGNTQTSTVAVTVTGSGPVTSLPQLLSAKIISTKTTAQVVNAAQAGTTVEYDFSQNVVNSPTAGNFKIYTFDDNVQTGTSIVSVSGSAVQVLFHNVTNTDNTGGAAANVNNYTLATAVNNTVENTSGQFNPDGSSAIGTSSTSSNTLSPNRTSTPDLVSVSNFRQGQTGQCGGVAQACTVTDFTFDVAAFDTSATGAGFNLVNQSNTVIACTGPVQGASAGTSGSTIPAGNGTTTITVACPDNNAGTASALSSSNLARAYVAKGTVDNSLADSAAPTAGNTNPDEAFHFGQFTLAPDLTATGVTLEPSGSTNNSTANDEVLYTFDQTVASVVSTDYFVINNAATETTAAAASATIGGTNNTQVLVTYPVHTLDNAVGAGVKAGGATGSSAANTLDELGSTTGSGSTTTITPGTVEAPQLSTVQITKTTNGFGQSQFSAVYTFTQPVTAVVTASAFKLYDANGNVFTTTTCTAGTGTTASQVTCSSYTVPAGITDISNAKLGTVDAAGVTGSTAPNNHTNPEGAQNVTS